MVSTSHLHNKQLFLIEISAAKVRSEHRKLT
uniref:Uncharacterized protein n=1 Tax=Rhizophora mucronata TaxID=61149 RepID=A0A2P2PXV1_RHIMU